MDNDFSKICVIIFTTTIVGLSIFLWNKSFGNYIINNKILIKADRRFVNVNDEYFSDINAALNSATENTRIYLDEGTYIVDNPIIIRKNGIKIIGSGREKTIIHPKNVGKAIFMFAADNVGVEAIKMSGKIKDVRGSAAFAIHIKKGCNGCEIRNTEIINTGATAIIGYAVNECSVENNIIGNAGDDAVRLRGHNLKITNNVIYDYMDEGIDVAGGDRIIVTNNYLSNGRIGIVVDDSRRAVIDGNVVENHYDTAIVLRSYKGGIVSCNIVNSSGEKAFSLISPLIVDSNKTIGNNRIGFNILNMSDGIVRKNISMNSGIGFNIENSIGNIIRSNIYNGNENIFYIDKYSNKNILYNNSTKKEIKIDEDVCIKNNEIYNSLEFEKRVPLGKKSDILNNIDYGGKSVQDKKIAGSIKDFLRHKNPGYLSVHIEGNTMRSEITVDLYNLLKEGGQHVDGLVRIPFKWFRHKADSFFPIWYLSIDNRNVVVVSFNKQAPAKVKVNLLENGKMNLKDTFSLWINWVISGIDYYFK
jgi:parallel beta-helix repeat protein